MPPAAPRPLDPGVLGMDHFRAAPPAIKESSKKALATFGSESDAVKQQKVESIAAGRARQADAFDIVRRSAKWLFLGFLLQSASKAVLARFLPARYAKAASVAAVLASFLRTFGLGERVIARDPRGAQDLPFFGTLIQMAHHRHHAHNFLLDVLRRCDFQTTQLRMPGISLFLLMNPLDREYVLRTNWRNYLKNRDNDLSNLELCMGEVLGRGIFATDNLEWQDSRKIASHLFSGNGLKLQMEAVFNAHAARTVEALEQIARERRVVDIQEIFQCVVFDAFCEIAFGLFPGASAAALGGVKPGFLVSFDAIQQYVAERVVQAPLQWHVNKLLGKTLGVGPDVEFLRHLAVVDAYVYKVVRDRKAEATDGRMDLLSLYVKHARETNQAHILEDTYLRDTIVNFMIAGRDTTSCTLTNMCRYLSENPGVVARLRATDLQLTKGQGVISMELTQRCAFANAIFNEAIRLQPPVGDDFRIAVADDRLPSGVPIREGDRVLLPCTAIGRDPSLWANPETFDPERWMTYDDQGLEQKVRRPDEFVMPVFWGGPRLCLGKDMARFEAIVFLARIFARLDVVSEPGQQGKTWVMGPVIFYDGGWRVGTAVV